MPNRRQRRRNLAQAEKSRKSISTSGQTKQIDRPEEKPGSTIERPQPQSDSVWQYAVHKRVSAWWLYVSILINMVMLIKNFSPDLSITASYGLNASDPLSAIFSIKNTGYVDIWSIVFRCIIYDGETELFNLSDITTINGPEYPATGLAPAPKIGSGDSATRDCIVSQNSGMILAPIQKPSAVRVDFSASYNWPFWPFGHTRTEHFSVRSFDKRLTLVPDVEGRPKP